MSPPLPPIPSAVLRHLSPHTPAALTGTLGLFSITMANYMLGPMRDASAMVVGVEHIPKMTFLSTLLALFSSVPVGWLFEAPDPKRRKVRARKKCEETLPAHHLTDLLPRNLLPRRYSPGSV
jgi:hypothetical protein